MNTVKTGTYVTSGNLPEKNKQILLYWQRRYKLLVSKKNKLHSVHIDSKQGKILKLSCFLLTYPGALLPFNVEDNKSITSINFLVQV